MKWRVGIEIHRWGPTWADTVQAMHWPNRQMWGDQEHYEDLLSLRSRFKRLVDAVQDEIPPRLAHSGSSRVRLRRAPQLPLYGYLVLWATGAKSGGATTRRPRGWLASSNAGGLGRSQACR